MEYGHLINDMELLVFNYVLEYDTENKEPLFYEKHSKSVKDI